VELHNVAAGLEKKMK